MTMRIQYLLLALLLMPSIQSSADTTPLQDGPFSLHGLVLSSHGFSLSIGCGKWWANAPGQVAQNHFPAFKCSEEQFCTFESSESLRCSIHTERQTESVYKRVRRDPKLIKQMNSELSPQSIVSIYKCASGCGALTSEGFVTSEHFALLVYDGGD